MIPLPHAPPLRSLLAVLLVTALAGAGAAQSPFVSDGPMSPRSIDPPWSRRTPRKEVVVHWDPSLGELANGEVLRRAVQRLEPGERLQVGAGVWSFDDAFDVNLRGTVDAPIWIEARRGERPVITRPDARQNVMNVGTKGPDSARFLIIRGLEFTGGSAGVRLHGCAQVWFDGNEVHHTQDGALTANTRDTAFLYITRNHLHHTGGYGEGMYLGANDGVYVMRHSIVARNHVHHCGGMQGDGIELKQGSYDNWIVENTIHDTKFPAILAYGTGGKTPNLIERNTIWNCQTNAMQVQGEAVVRNNLIVGGEQGFHTHDHQGQTRDLVVVHNTIITTGLGAELYSWDGRPGMVFANNAVFSRSGKAVIAERGAAGAAFGGNVVFGAVEGVPAEGFTSVSGLGVLESADWDAAPQDARPRAGTPLIDAGDPRFTVWDDLHGSERGSLPDVGCLERR